MESDRINIPTTLTRRDGFAAIALHALLLRPSDGCFYSGGYYKGKAIAAQEAADALIKQLDSTEK